MSQQGDESDHFTWKNQSCENLFNEVVPILGQGEDKGKDRGQVATKNTKGKGKNMEKKEGEEASSHEIHIWTERERRKKMRNMFSNLHSLLPHLLPKADKTTVVEEAISYIKTLESTLQRLEKQKLEKLQICSTPNTLDLTHEPLVGATTNLAMFSTREAFMADQVSLMTNTTTNNQDNNNSVVPASTSSLPDIIHTWTSSNVVLNICGNDAQFVVYVPKKLGLFTTLCCVLEKHMLEVISAHILSHDDQSVYMIQARAVNGAYDQFPAGLMTLEEIYKQAAGEMMMWVSS